MKPKSKYRPVKIPVLVDGDGCKNGPILEFFDPIRQAASNFFHYSRTLKNQREAGAKLTRLYQIYRP
jgi:hypothetical protein